MRQYFKGKKCTEFAPRHLIYNVPPLLSKLYKLIQAFIGRIHPPYAPWCAQSVGKSRQNLWQQYSSRAIKRRTRNCPIHSFDQKMITTLSTTEFEIDTFYIDEVALNVSSVDDGSQLSLLPRCKGGLSPDNWISHFVMNVNKSEYWQLYIYPLYDVLLCHVMQRYIREHVIVAATWSNLIQ